MSNARPPLARAGAPLGALALSLACAACGRSTEPSPSDAQADALADDAAPDDAPPGDDAGNAPTDAQPPCPDDASPATACATTGDCCGAFICQAARCCLPHDAACTATTECCIPGLCLDRTDAAPGTCQQPPH